MHTHAHAQTYMHIGSMQSLCIHRHTFVYVGMYIGALGSAAPVRFCTAASVILRHVAAGYRIQAARGQAEGEHQSPLPAGRPATKNQFRSSFWLVGMTGSSNGSDRSVNRTVDARTPTYRVSTRVNLYGQIRESSTTPAPFNEPKSPQTYGGYHQSDILSFPSGDTLLRTTFLT